MMRDVSRRSLLKAAPAVMLAAPSVAVSRDRFAAAAAYSAASNGVSMLVLEGGREVFRDHPRGAERPYELASGTKSFSGVLAAAMVQDGLLSLDERCADTLAEWRDQEVLGSATVRALLQLSSGVGGGALSPPPSYGDAVARPPAGAAGVFRYGPVPFQVFGEIVRRKLVATGQPDDVLAHLRVRLLDPVGVEIGGWRRQEGQPNLPSGAQLTATAWARFGQFVLEGGRGLVDPAALDECFRPSASNPGYGLTWWLLRPGLVPPGARSGIDPDAFHRLGGLDVRMAAGAGNQRLYLIPDRELVVVRQADRLGQALMGRGAAWSDVEFLTRLLGPS